MRSPRSLVTALTLGLGLVGSALVAPTGSASADGRRGAASISVSPATGFVAGQAQTLTGSLGVTGKRAIWVEGHMNRPGDQWFPIEGSETTTRKDGSFTITRPAPSMFGISLRIAAAGYATPEVRITGATQELFVWTALDRETAWTEAVHPVAGEPFTVVVDTTPEQLHRTDIKGLPAFPGRTLTLQRRIGPEAWQSLATTQVGADGMGYFAGVVEPDVGPVVYRVRAERIWSGADRIGWHASFPLAVEVTEQATAYEWWTPTATESVKSLESGAARTAGVRYRWGHRMFDFDWEYGEDLDSKPGRGAKLRGRWIPSSDGSGRASVQNGQVVLFSSMSGRASTGDHGTTRVTQSGNARKRGRWEARLRWQVLESAATDYRLRAELVPPGTPSTGCAAESITLASWSPRGTSLDIGVTKAGRTFARTVAVPALLQKAPALGIEIGKKHMTWFVNGKKVASIKGKKRQLGRKLVLRLSLEGGPEEHNSTKLFSDWQRGFSIKQGKQVVAKTKVRRSATPLC